MKKSEIAKTRFSKCRIYWAITGIVPKQGGGVLDNHGFTLVELIIAVAIIGILATMAIPSYNDMSRRAKIAGAKADIRTLENAIGAYLIDQNKLPTLLSSIGTQGSIKDAWGHNYQFYNIITNTGDRARYISWAIDPVTLDNCLNHDYDLYSLGADGDTLNNISNPVDPPTTSSDDIVRVAEGSSIELASDY